MSQTPTTALPLETISEKGKAPKSRVASAGDAQTIVQSLIQSNRERARFNSKIKGMLDGNPPYNAATLKANAQSYRANVNFMEGESMLSAALVPYYDLFAGAQTYCDIKLYDENPDEAVAKSRIATEEFDCLLKKYDDFEFNMNGLFHDLIAFGKGFLRFPSNWGWHFERVEFGRVFVPDGSKASVAKLELVAIREKTQVHELWNFIKDKEKAKAVGWDPDAVAEAIRNAVPEERANQSNDTLHYEYVQQMMRDKDIVEGTRQPTVAVAHLLVKEFDGRVTHLMVLEETRIASGNHATDGSKAPEIVPKFLFEKVGRFSAMREVLSAFFFETLDGSWNGARGLGHKIYSSIEIKNRLLCKTVDNAFLSGGITLQANDANALQKTSLVQAGDFNIIPPGYTVQNAQIFARSEGLVGTNQLLDQTISSNTGIFKAKPEKPAGNPRTAKEVEIQFNNATVLSNSGVSRFYSQCDPFYTELFRRVTEGELLDSDKGEEADAVREFQRRCAKRGVTLKDLKNVESVRATRNIGNGSQFQRQQSLERFTPYASMLTEGGREQWMADLVASEFNHSAVERYMPEREKQLRPNDQQAMAVIENAVLKTGAPVAWTPTQNNVIHATEHLKAMASAVASLQQDAEPMSVLGFLEAVGPHVQLHLEKLKGDPSRQTEYKLLSEKFSEFVSFTDQLAAHVEDEQNTQQQAQQEQAMAAAKAQAVQDGTDPEVAIKAAQAQFDMKLKEAKTAQQLRLKDEAGKQKLAMNDLKLAQNLKHAAVKHAAEVRQQAAGKE